MNPFLSFDQNSQTCTFSRDVVITQETDLGNYSIHFSPQSMPVIYSTDLSWTGLPKHLDSAFSLQSAADTSAMSHTGKGCRAAIATVAAGSDRTAAGTMRTPAWSQVCSPTGSAHWLPLYFGLVFFHGIVIGKE